MMYGMLTLIASFSLSIDIPFPEWSQYVFDHQVVIAFDASG